MPRGVARVLAVGLALTCGCEPPPARWIAGDGGPGDAAVPATVPRPVDLLFLVDNSNSMAQEQSSLTSCFGGQGSGALIEPPDEDEDGVPDRGAVADLHLGVITTDMGTAGYPVQTCAASAAGDDGLLQHRASGALAGCDDTYPRYLEWKTGDDAGALTSAFACLATLGTGGCGFEQHFGALRRALVDHADGSNRGFLRDDSTLVIVIDSDEDDATVRDDPDAERIFDVTADLGPLNLRAFLHPELLVPPEEIARELLSLRDSPEHLVVGAHVGIPRARATDCRLTPPADLDCLLAEPTLQVTIDESPEGKGERITPSCDEVMMGEAFPPRRILEVLRALQDGGAVVAVRSVCDGDPYFLFRDLAEAVAPPTPDGQ